MIGAIADDIIGSIDEGFSPKAIDFPLYSKQSHFTDDTVLSVVVAHWVLEGGNLIDLFHAYVASYPQAGYGMSFLN